jgi:hypothetical protein
VTKPGDTENKIFNEELFFDGNEAGKANFQWHHSNEFAVKLCDYED